MQQSTEKAGAEGIMILRPIEIADAEELVSWGYEPQDVEEQREWIAKRREQHNIFEFVGVIDGEIVASFSIVDKVDFEQLSFAVSPKHRDKGYGHEVARLGMQYIKRKKVKAFIDAENIASIRIAKKLGLVNMLEFEGNVGSSI